MYSYDYLIISNESVLLEQYMPEDILHREGQKQFLAECIKPASLGRKIRNVFLYGPPGTGKTMLTRWIASELENSATGTKSIYVNCWNRSTAYTILGEILNQAETFVSPREAMSSMLTKFDHITKNHEKKLIIILDEVDQIESDEILYNISRSGAGIICISNDPYAISNVDERIRSSLYMESMEFPAYTADQMTDILEQRARYALAPTSINRDDIKAVARFCNGDSRVGLEILRKAALIAENENKRKISIENIKKAFQDAKSLRKEKLESKLSQDELEILRIVRAGKKVNATQIYEKYSNNSKKPVTERALRKYLKKFIKSGLIKYEGDGRWRTYLPI